MDYFFIKKGVFAMNEGSEVKNGDEKQKKVGSQINQSINQSNTFHLVKNENLKEFLYKNLDLKKRLKKQKN